MSVRNMRTTAATLAMAIIGASLAAVGAPSAHAAFTPAKTSSVTVSVDGVTLGIDDSVTDMSGPRSGIFGGAQTPPTATSDPGTGELTEMYAAKAGSFVNFESRGGIKAITCTDLSTVEYRRSQVTVGNLPTGTNDVWVFYDSTVGPRVGPTPQFNDLGSMVGATGTSGQTDITVSTTEAAMIAVGDQIRGSGVAPLATVTAVNSGTGVVTLDLANVGTISGNVTIYKERIGATSNLENLCDGTTPYVTGATGTSATPGALTLGSTSATPNSTARINAGVLVNDTTAASVSFDIYVPTNGNSSGATENFIALGIVVDAGGTGSLNDSTSDDTAIFTHVVSKPWEGNDRLLSACSSPTATADQCFVTADTGIFQSDGTTRVGSTSEFSVVTSSYAASGQALMDARVGFTSALGDGFAIPAGSIVKMSLSLPTSGTVDGINYASLPFSLANGTTGLLVDPRTTSSSSAINRWDASNVSSRDIITITGQARATSTAISRSTWYEECQISISGSTVTTNGCGEGMTSSVSSGYLVFTSVPGSVQLSVSNDSVIQTLAGGLVSTNAQGIEFGPETMTGTSFQFAVAGPSYTSSDASRSTDGFYYVCVPEDFLAGSFSTTVSGAQTDWVGTRDGSAVGTGFAAGTCATEAGLVAYLDPFGYSAPLFSLQPRAVEAPASSGGESTPATTTTTPATTPQVTTESVPQVVATPTVAPVTFPKLTIGRSVTPAYVAKLAQFPKSYRLKLSIPKMYKSKCSIVKGKVVAKSVGTCGIRVEATSRKGKKYVKRVYLTTVRN